MKIYIKPTVDVIVLMPEEQIANPNSSGLPSRSRSLQNNGHGNFDQDAPGNSLYNNGAENNQNMKK